MTKRMGDTMADGMIAPPSQQKVEFVKLIAEGFSPRRADRSAAGYLPGRALRYCDAITSATGWGYWAFSPIDLQLLWDGEHIFWTYGDHESWLPLSATPSSAVQFPGYAEQFDETATAGLQGYSPPFLTALTEPGVVQIWTGLIARTRPGWSLMMRPPANLPGIAGLVGWEGVVETDHWFGPLFGIFRITRTDVPVQIRSHVPLIQFQPIPQLAYRDDELNDFSCRSAEDLSEAEWEEFSSIVMPSSDPNAILGDYAVKTRKRRTCPYHTEIVRNAVSSPV